MRFCTQAISAIGQAEAPGLTSDRPFSRNLKNNPSFDQLVSPSSLFHLRVFSTKILHLLCNHFPTSKMPTNRPFLANFLAAFRAHSALQKASSTTAVSTSTQSTHLSPLQSPTSTTHSTARAITSKGSPPTAGATTAAVQAASHLSHHTRHPSSTPMSKSPASPRGPGSAFDNRQRRGSDSSSEGGFRDALGAEKWYIGGRTAHGEERFYRLGMVKRERSGDRMSLDRMSL